MIRKIQSVVLLVVFSFEIIYPTVAYALTDGPSQPEVSGFSPISNDNMVNLFTGDFNYNIPLMDVGGYPINLAYEAGIGMEQEASWVGLGWSVNPGSITRNLRGLPDDFQGDRVVKQISMKKNYTVGVEGGMGVEVFGYGGLSGGLGVFYNSYKGYGLTANAGISRSAGSQGKSEKTGSLGININANSQEGLEINPTINLKKTESNTDGNSISSSNSSASFGGSFSTRAGLKSINFDRKKSTRSTEIDNTSDKASEVNSSGKVRSSSFSFASSAYMPSNQTPMLVQNYSLKIGLGLEAIGAFPHAYIKGYYSSSLPLSTLTITKSYGYLYEDKKGKSEDVLLDYNKEKDGVFVKEQKVLPVPVHTFDLFNITGEGVSGQCRVFRNDIGVVFDNCKPGGSVAASLGGEASVAISGIAKLGFDGNAVLSRSISRKWFENNDMKKYADFYSSNSIIPNYEPAYFKLVGEQTIVDDEYNNRLFKGDLISPGIKGSALLPTAKNSFNRYKSNLDPNGEDNVTQALQRNKRNIRGTSISYLRVGEKIRLTRSHAVTSYPLNNVGTYPSGLIQQYYHIPIDLMKRPFHHIGEITVTKPDGKRYNYGIPAYNNKQKEVSFSVTKPTSLPPNGIINYVSNGTNPDNSVNNVKGIDNFFSAQTTPQYAHSYLLTSIVSPDYVDRSQDGPTSDDPGTWVKFNYTRQSKSYKWRMPYLVNTATYNEGYKSDALDDKGSYIYGEKEIWVLHSIESRNFISIFYTNENRLDGFGVMSENGGIDLNQKQVKLDKIVLYSKADLVLNGFANSTPIKTVHFEYSYELCKGVYNNSNYNPVGSPTSDSGKLTLKKVYFTYGKSTRGELNKYIFSYANNPNFNPEGNDRWGTYKNPNSAYNPSGVSNNYFPYTSNNKTEADNDSRAWNLSKVDLPSGGSIEVNYEADDYAYVQDKRACEMLQVLSVGPTSDINNSKVGLNFYENENTPFNYWFISIPYPVNTKQEIKDRYIAKLTSLYFKANTIIKDSKSEFVNGYAEIVDYGPVAGNTNKIWIKVASEKAKGFSTSPVTKIGLQMLRTDLQSLAYPHAINPDADIEKMAKSLLGVIGEVKNLIFGFEKIAVSKNWAKNFVSGQFWVKLSNPQLKRIGGGSRVSSIRLNDDWNNATVNNESSNTYLTKYEYETEVKINNVNVKISSGVAAYEPMMGSEENVFHQPIRYSIRSYPLSPIDNRYFEEPICESYFPAAVVGYSKVKVVALDPTSNLPLGNGYNVSEFYTAKDYPTIVLRNDIKPKVFNPKLLSTFIKFLSTDLFTASQGYYVELNDMHGKTRAESNFNSSNILISGTRYKYKDGFNLFGKRHLVNEVDVVDRSSSVSTGEIGVDTEVTLDMRESNTKTISAGAQFNVDLIPFPPPVNALPIFETFPNLFLEFVRLRTAVAAKVVNKSGIIDYIETFREGSSVKENILVYDKISGRPIIKSHNDEFGRQVYDIAQPAYWKYKNMGGAYDNIGMVFKATNPPNNFLSVPNSLLTVLNHGDELMPATVADQIKLIDYFKGLTIPRFPSYNRFWISYPLTCYTGSNPLPALIIDDDGNKIDINMDISFKVVRSGKKNQMNDNMASFVATGSNSNSLNPYLTNGNPKKVSFTELSIIDMSATEYNDNWKLESTTHSKKVCDTVVTLTDWPCFKTFVDGLIKLSYNPGYNLLYHSMSQSYTVGQIINAGLPNCTSSTAPTFLGNYNVDSIYFMPLVQDVSQTSAYYANLGPDCYISIIPNTVPANVDLNELPNNILNSDYPNCLTIGSAQHVIYTICLHCKQCDIECEVFANNEVYNPFKEGLINRWHPYKTWSYNGTRILNSNLRANESGLYTNYTLPFEYNSGTNKWDNNFISQNSRWVKTSETTKIHRMGTEIESINALDKFSSAMFAYNNEVPIVVSKNTKYKELFFSSYEDEFYLNGPYSCSPKRWDVDKLSEGTGFDFENSIAHTGKYSIKINQGGQLKYKAFEYAENINECNFNLKNTTFEYVFDHNSANPRISPEWNQNYLLNVWIHKENACDVENFGDIGYINIYGLPGTPSPQQVIAFEPKSTILDGWQLYQANVSFSAQYSTFEVVFDGVEEMFIDDFRMSPLKSDTKCFVYHPSSLKLMATLDANHFTTFYEYDEEGNLIRTKKETERGIVTVNEHRKNVKKQ